MASEREPSRVLSFASTSILDAVFANGWGEASYATQTRGRFTFLMRVHPSTSSLVPVAILSWPERRRRRGGGGEVLVSVVDEKVPGKLRSIIPNVHIAPWRLSSDGTPFSTTKIFQRFSSDAHTGIINISRITITRASSGHRPFSSFPCPCPSWSRRELSCTLELYPYPDGSSFEDDVDVIIAGILLLVASPMDWRKYQSDMSVGQLEASLTLTHLRMDGKSPPVGEDEDGSLGMY